MSSRPVVLFVMSAFVVAELIITVGLTAVAVAASGRVFDVADLPAPARTALVLGSLVHDDVPGDPVRGRLDTTLQAWRQGKVNRIIVSGNGSAQAGDEPRVMRGYLTDRGIPTSAIVDDPAGFDTDASCRTAREVFQVNQLIVVTQDFHVDRAIMLCRSRGVDAVGLRARCDCSTWLLIRNRLRETLLSNPRALLGRLGSTCVD